MLADAASELRAVNTRQAREGLKRLHASLVGAEGAGRTPDDVFREAGTWDGDDPEDLEATLRAARDAGGSKPPAAL